MGPTTFADVLAASYMEQGFKGNCYPKEADLVEVSKIPIHLTHVEISCQQSYKLSMVRYPDTLKKSAASWWPVG